MVTLRTSRILVSGASGMVGSALVPTLKAGGAQVVRLARLATLSRSDEQNIPWDPSQVISPEAVSGFDAVIHLAGESIVGRGRRRKKPEFATAAFPRRPTWHKHWRRLR